MAFHWVVMLAMSTGVIGFAIFSVVLVAFVYIIGVIDFLPDNIDPAFIGFAIYCVVLGAYVFYTVIKGLIDGIGGSGSLGGGGCGGGCGGGG